jgi:hypothetical protein
MPGTAQCSCGHVIRYRDEEEFYGLVRRHIVPLDREQHRLLRSSTAPRSPRRPLVATGSVRTATRGRTHRRSS